MDVWQAISGIRAVRAFADRPLDPDHLERILNAGRRAPSSKNSQRWDFILCRDREHLRELSSVGAFAQHVATAAAALALVAPASDDPDRWAWTMFDLGQAAQNVMLAAWELGVGSAHAAVHHPDRARELLGYPEDRRCDLLISFGYPADASLVSSPPRKGGRRPLQEIVHDERW